MRVGIALLALLAISCAGPGRADAPGQDGSQPTTRSEEAEAGAYPKPDRRKFRISASPARQRTPISRPASLTVRVRVPKEAEVRWEVLWGDEKGGGVMAVPNVDCVPPPPGPPAPIEWRSAEKAFSHVYKKPGRYRLEVRVSAADCGYGEMLTDEVSVKVSA